jgi:hypothetical protein
MILSINRLDGMTMMNFHNDTLWHSCRIRHFSRRMGDYHSIEQFKHSGGVNGNKIIYSGNLPYSILKRVNPRHGIGASTRALHFALVSICPTSLKANSSLKYLNFK